MNSVIHYLETYKYVNVFVYFIWIFKQIVYTYLPMQKLKALFIDNCIKIIKSL